MDPIQGSSPQQIPSLQSHNNKNVQAEALPPIPAYTTYDVSQKTWDDLEAIIYGSPPSFNTIISNLNVNNVKPVRGNLEQVSQNLWGFMQNNNLPPALHAAVSALKDKADGAISLIDQGKGWPAVQACCNAAVTLHKNACQNQINFATQVATLDNTISTGELWRPHEVDDASKQLSEINLDTVDDNIKTSLEDIRDAFNKYYANPNINTQHDLTKLIDALQQSIPRPYINGK